jgi:hypothetical protein
VIPLEALLVLIMMAMDFRLSLGRWLLVLLGLAYVEAFYIPGMVIASAADKGGLS